MPGSLGWGREQAQAGSVSHSLGDLCKSFFFSQSLTLLTYKMQGGVGLQAYFLGSGNLCPRD